MVWHGNQSKRYIWKMKIRRYILKRNVRIFKKNKKSINIIIGADNTTYRGWISTDLPMFDVLKPSDWSYIFSNVSIDRMLAEHVIEHWTETEFRLFLRIAAPFLS